MLRDPVPVGVCNLVVDPGERSARRPGNDSPGLPAQSKPEVFALGCPVRLRARSPPPGAAVRAEALARYSRRPATSSPTPRCTATQPGGARRRGGAAPGGNPRPARWSRPASSRRRAAAARQRPGTAAGRAHPPSRWDHSAPDPGRVSPVTFSLVELTVDTGRPDCLDSGSLSSASRFGRLGLTRQRTESPGQQGFPDLTGPTPLAKPGKGRVHWRQADFRVAGQF
jgi:hypothetical protein